MRSRIVILLLFLLFCITAIISQAPFDLDKNEPNQLQYDFRKDDSQRLMHSGFNYGEERKNTDEAIIGSLYGSNTSQEPFTTQTKEYKSDPKEIALKQAHSQNNPEGSAFEQNQTQETFESKKSILDINAEIRKATVNIICTSKYGGYFNIVSGSGILLNESGLILTNAHIAQYLFIRDNLKEDSMECYLRSGDPAKGKFQLDLVFIPYTWVSKNAKNVNENKTIGSGENDFAILKVRDYPIDKPFEIHINFILDDKTALIKGEDVLVSGYPGQLLGGILAQTDLHMVSSIGNIIGIFSFSESLQPELIEITNTVLAQGGVSGGPVFDLDGQLIAMVTTASDAEDKVDRRKIGAITMFHVKDIIFKETGLSLERIIIDNQWTKLRQFFDSKSKEMFEMLKNKLFL
jgi:hypothetical protein